MLAEDVFGYNLKYKMKEKGIGVKRLSDKTGVSMTSIYEARRGRTVPTSSPHGNRQEVWKRP